MKGKGKKLAAFVLALGLLLLLCAGALAEEYGVVINTDTLNLRSQGSSSSTWPGHLGADYRQPEQFLSCGHA